jgi:hypothetical protein
MKKSGQKKYFLSAWLFLAFAALFILISVTMAAYTSKASVKRVVSTKGSSGAMFSSNYLSQTTLFKSVSFISTETAPTVVVNVCNYAQGDKTKHYEDSDISYTLEAVLTDVDGQPLSAEAYDESSFDNFSVTFGGSKLKFTADESGNFSLSFGSVLSKDYVSTDSYSVSFDAAQLENPTVYVKLTATAESAVSGVSKLSGVLGVTKHSAAQSVSWTGSFTDNFAIYSNKYDSRDFDAFNYAVSGSGSGKFTLVWNT